MAPDNRDPAPDPEPGIAASAGGLVEGFLRDWMTNGAVLFSLVVIAAGLFEGEGAGRVLAVVVGVVGTVVAFVTIRKAWSPARTWLTVLAILVIDAAVLALVLT